MYRLLAAYGETQPRRLQRNHRNVIKPELIAVQPNEVWSWDITKLLSKTRLVYYYLYVILDIYSLYVVGWMLAEKECQHLAKKLIHTSALRQGIKPGQLTLHADNGPSMTSGTVAQLLEHIGVIKTHNRPYTSNDNPFSESQFKTLKYCPTFPKRFEYFEQAESFCPTFFHGHNSQHYHSGIHYLTPETVHFGKGKQVLEKRFQTLTKVFQQNPARFNNKKPQKKMFQPVYINPPQIVEINAGQNEGIMA
jgi:transposase InsO family protein